MFITIEPESNRVILGGTVRFSDEQVEYLGEIPQGTAWVWNEETQTVELSPEHYRYVQETESSQAKKFLADTDWKVTRHRDQLDLGQPTSMTAEAFAELLAQRQTAREKVQEWVSPIPLASKGQEPSPQVDYD